MPDFDLENLTKKLEGLTPRVFFPPVVLCVGSDRVTGDCLGPLVGHILTTELNTSAYVYGTLSNPVNALNLTATLDFILSRHPGCFIIAVDSSLGHKHDIGKIHIINGGIFPGAAAGKILPKVGDIAVTATVAELKTTGLYGVSLGFVYNLAKNIASAVSKSILSRYLCAAALQ